MRTRDRSRDSESDIARHITISGVVQGVGFRPFVYTLAQRLGVRGWVLNHSGGVDIEVEGPDPQVAAFVTALEAEAPPLAQIEALTLTAIAPNGYRDFQIRHSQAQEGRYQLISPDVATCPDCLRELFDPADRRYRYPFINCTNCGPRFTIIEEIPYDRPKTTMRVFPLCDACRAEYEEPTDRRFHAQPNACPVCGPHIWLCDPDGVPLVGDPQVSDTEGALSQVRARLLEGQIVAIKGLGGFHLACDATNSEAVRTLRERKRRPHKPFALMVATLAQAQELVEVPAAAEDLLTSSHCPIVLLERRSDCSIAPEVAPNSNQLGIMLAYTPLHHILLRDIGRPLVMTSGNLSEEPIAKDNDEALRRLGTLADAFLLHNRDIHARYDDSVWHIALLGGEKAQPLRRARGYAPSPIRLPFEMQQIFAAGPLLKNTFAFTRDTYVFISQHIGDLENLDTLEHYQAALETYRRLFRLDPKLVACDLHPDYLSTRFAQRFAHELGLAAPYQVQHHHAHIAACLADNGITAADEPVIGVALDGTGYGEDGNIWGGEWFVGGYTGFKRVAHLEYLPLPGGDAAILHPWRAAVAYCDALLGSEALPTGIFCPSEVLLVRQQITRRVNTPMTSSAGRLFDAVSALLGVCSHASYEAQAAIELEQVAAATDRDSAAAYPFALDRESFPWQIRLSPLFEALRDEMESGAPTAQIALRFHSTVAQIIYTVCAQVRERYGLNTVALSGGVFQNRLLLSMVEPLLQRGGFRTLLHRQVPTNDGGIALGQAVLAQHALSAES